MTPQEQIAWSILPPDAKELFSGIGLTPANFLLFYQARLCELLPVQPRFWKAWESTLQATTIERISPELVWPYWLATILFEIDLSAQKRRAWHDFSAVRPEGWRVIDRFKLVSPADTIALDEMLQAALPEDLCQIVTLMAKDRLSYYAISTQFKHGDRWARKQVATAVSLIMQNPEYRQIVFDHLFTPA